MIIGISIPDQNQEDRRNEFIKTVKTDIPKEGVMIQEKAKKKSNYFYEVLNYLKSKRIEIYIKMQSQDVQTQRTGIEQWDKMEALIENVKKNKDNKDYLNLLYEKIQKLKSKEEQKEKYL